MINSFLLKLNRTSFILSGIGLSILSLLLHAIVTPQFETLNTGVSYSTIPNIIEAFFKGVLFAPIAETMIFQTFIYWLIKKTTKTKQTRNLLFLIISSFAFGYSHYYSIEYITYATFIGIILAYYYLISIKRTESAIKNIFIIHASFNFILFSGGTILYLIDNNCL